MANNIPSIFDRADGSGPFGTPIPIEPVSEGGAIGINYAGGNDIIDGYIPIFEEYSDSPEVEVGEQSTIVHRFHCDYLTGQTLILAYQRGTLMVDTQGRISRVLTSKLQPIAKTDTNECNFTVTSECMSFGTPPDEFNISTVELNPVLEKHPRYSALTYAQRVIVRNAAESINGADYAQQYRNLISTFSASVNQYTDQQGQGLEYLFKRQKGEDTFYLSGYKISWSKYFWLPQTINPGGYIEDPILQGGLPYIFWSTNGTPDGNSIFAATTLFNGNMFPTPIVGPPFGLSWLRQTDQVDLQRTWFKYTYSWIGAPIGVWDNELYNQVPQPLNTSDTQGGFAL